MYFALTATEWPPDYIPRNSICFHSFLFTIFRPSAVQYFTYIQCSTLPNTQFTGAQFRVQYSAFISLSPHLISHSVLFNVTCSALHLIQFWILPLLRAWQKIKYHPLLFIFLGAFPDTTVFSRSTLTLRVRNCSTFTLPCITVQCTGSCSAFPVHSGALVFPFLSLFKVTRSFLQWRTTLDFYS